MAQYDTLDWRYRCYYVIYYDYASGSSGANYLFNAEIPGPAAERTLPKIKESAFVIFTVYIFFTIITTVALKVAGMSWFMAMNLALASVATGGFSYQLRSLMEFETVYVE